VLSVAVVELGSLGLPTYAGQDVIKRFPKRTIFNLRRAVEA